MNQALITGTPIRRIAADTGLAESSIRRHRDSHLSPALADAMARHAEVDADRLLAWALGLHERTLAAVARTETQRDWPNMRAFVREARENLALLGRLSGVLDAATVHVDARRQVAVLSNLSDDDLKSLAAAAREGQLEQAADRLGLPSPQEAVPVPAEREEAEWRPTT